MTVNTIPFALLLLAGVIVASFLAMIAADYWEERMHDKRYLDEWQRRLRGDE